MNVVDYSKNGLGEITHHNKVIIKIADNLFSTHTITNKNISASQAKKSIPFNLESELLDNIDDLEFFIKKTGDTFNVVSISKQVLLDLKNNIKEQKLEVIGAYLSFMFVPQAEGKISYQQQDDNIVFRTGNFEGGSVDKSLFYNMFNEEDVVEVSESSRDYQKINLLTYNFSEFNSKFVKPYMSVVMLLLVILCTTIAFHVVENNNISSKLEAKTLANKALFTSMFPGEPIVDIRAQTEQRLSSLSAQQTLAESDFLTKLLAAKLERKKIKSLVLVFGKDLEVQ